MLIRSFHVKPVSVKFVPRYEILLDVLLSFGFFFFSIDRFVITRDWFILFYFIYATTLSFDLIKNNALFVFFILILTDNNECPVKKKIHKTVLHLLSTYVVFQLFSFLQKNQMTAFQFIPRNNIVK